MDTLEVIDLYLRAPVLYSKAKVFLVAALPSCGLCGKIIAYLIPAAGGCRQQKQRSCAQAGG